MPTPRRGDHDYDVPEDDEQALDPWGNPIDPDAPPAPPAPVERTPAPPGPHDPPHLPGGSDFDERNPGEPPHTPTPLPSPYDRGFAGDDPNLRNRHTQSDYQPNGQPFGSSSLSEFLQELLRQGPAHDSSGQRSALMTRLTGLMDQYGQPVSADDPLIKGRTDAYAANMDRSLSKFREFAAERGHAEGVPSGAFDSQVGGAIQAGGQAVGDFQGQLMTDELNHRRSNLSTAISQGASTLTAQDQADIQQRMSTIDGALRAMGLDLQRDLGMSELDLRRLIAGNQNNQFYDDFAYRQARDAEGTDADLIRLLLGG